MSMDHAPPEPEQDFGPRKSRDADRVIFGKE